MESSPKSIRLQDLQDHTESLQALALRLVGDEATIRAGAGTGGGHRFELTSFIHLLDKLISDNINKDFFRGDVELEEEVPRGEGKVEVRQKGTLRLLEEWLKKKVRFKDDQPLIDMIATFKKIRKLRQKPAHSVHDDAFDQRFFKEQRELLVEAYTAVRTLRLIFANDSRTASVKVDQALYEGKIWSY